jgi:hypothetical protein
MASSSNGYSLNTPFEANFVLPDQSDSPPDSAGNEAGRRSLLEVAAEHFEGVLGCPEADAVAVSGELELFDLGVFAV